MELQRLETGQHPRHRHVTGYAALVIAGHYEEVGDTGRWTIEAGDCVYHQPYEAHQNSILKSCSIINLEIPGWLSLPPVTRVADMLGLQSAMADGPQAIATVLANQTAKPLSERDWPDLLARDLRKSRVRLSDWAAGAGLLPETVSRGFFRAFGVTPARYSREARTRNALSDIMTGERALSDIAFGNGFSDQAHLTRSVTALTGRSPGAWRKVKNVQDHR